MMSGSTWTPSRNSAWKSPIVPNGRELGLKSGSKSDYGPILSATQSRHRDLVDGSNDAYWCCCWSLWVSIVWLFEFGFYGRPKLGTPNLRPRVSRVRVRLELRRWSRSREHCLAHCLDASFELLCLLVAFGQPRKNFIHGFNRGAGSGSRAPRAPSAPY